MTKWQQVAAMFCTARHIDMNRHTARGENKVVTCKILKELFTGINLQFSMRGMKLKFRGQMQVVLQDHSHFLSKRMASPELKSKAFRQRIVVLGGPL